MLNKKSPGQKLQRFPAEAWNTIVDAQTALGQGRVLTPSPTIDRRPGLCKVKNLSGSARQRFEILAFDFDDPGLISADDNLAQFQAEPAFRGVLPADDYRGSFCILLEPLGQNKIGLAVFDGLACCQIDLRHASDRYADLKAGVATMLESAGDGAAVIVARQQGDTGTKWAWLRLGPLAGYWHGTLDGDLVAGSYATVSRYYDNAGTWTDTLSNETVYACPELTAGTLASGTWVRVRWNLQRAKYEVVGAQC